MSRFLLRFKDARRARVAAYREALVWAEASTDSAQINFVEPRSEFLLWADYGRDSIDVGVHSETISFYETATDSVGLAPIEAQEALSFTESGSDAYGVVHREVLFDTIGPVVEDSQDSIGTIWTPSDTYDGVGERLSIGESYVARIDAVPLSESETWSLSEAHDSSLTTHVVSNLTELVELAEIAPTIARCIETLVDAKYDLTENGVDDYAHYQQDTVDLQTETLTVHEAMLNLFLEATGYLMIEVESDVTNRNETTTSVESFPVVESFTDVFVRTDLDEYVQEQLVLTSSDSYSVTRSRSASADPESVTASDAMRAGLRGSRTVSESVSTGSTVDSTISHYNPTAWTETHTETLTLNESRVSRVSSTDAMAEMLLLAVPAVDNTTEWIYLVENGVSDINNGTSNTETFAVIELAVDVYFIFGDAGTSEIIGFNETYTDERGSMDDLAEALNLGSP